MLEVPEWYNFQEEICKHFISIGAEAKTNQKIKGIRTEHDIDILVKTKFLGEDLLWIIEAKNWKTNITKEKVFALRAIVDDLGADRGFIISQNGFQKGAWEAIQNTNITLKTFEELKKITSELIQEEILKAYKKRTLILFRKYWSHDKDIRKKYRLRPDFLEDFRIIFSANILIDTIIAAIDCAENNIYPINLELKHEKKVGEDLIQNFQQLRNWLDLNLNLLDDEIFNAEYLMQVHGDFNPNMEVLNPKLGSYEDMKKMSISDIMKDIIMHRGNS